MTTQPPRSYTTPSIAIVVGALVIAAAILASSDLGIRKTVTETSTSTTTLTTVNGTNQTSTVCSVAVPPPQGIYLRLVNDSGSPIAGYEVTIQYALGASCNPSGVHLETLVTTTNSSGMILFQGWFYYFVFIYSGGTYNFTVPTDPMAWTVGTISLPSGTLTTEICGLGGGALNSSCVNSSTTTVSTTLTNLDSLVYSGVAGGIQLSALIQPEGQVYGRNFTITATVRDVLTTPIQLSATELDNPAYGPCPQSFAAVNLYNGRYTSANISQASPLQLYNPNQVYLCPTESMLHYSLSPTNDITETSVISGYWTGSGQNYVHTAIPPGFYTVVVVDAWNQTAIGYLQAYYPTP